MRCSPNVMSSDAPLRGRCQGRGPGWIRSGSEASAASCAKRDPEQQGFGGAAPRSRVDHAAARILARARLKLTAPVQRPSPEGMQRNNRDTVLGRLVQHFSKLSLKNANLAEPDMLGRAYEYLIEQFADDAGKKGGEFYTPTKVVQLLVELLAPKEGMRVCDPTCGSGGMLVQMAKYVERHGGNAKNLTLHGQEKNLGTWAICKMNMLLHGLSDARVEKGDTIRDPKLLKDGALLLYDRVIANPPFSLDEWGVEVAEKDCLEKN